ncbi:outer membrane protein assembly factor BamE [Acetobacteraceae bacterium ESL0709]|nr:outer membrane protein assembly factor BamE [Acetobacteraceae bacterium ESL0697]MDF7678350.1 outer membrane protein assembly factor BamE [Acetobacteraceae bacterium ESL0709]
MTSESPYVTSGRKNESCITYQTGRLTRCRKRTRSVLLLASLLVAGGCSVVSPPKIPRGSLVEEYEYKKLVPGTSTRDDVLNLIGSPTARGTFNDDSWYYITLTKNLVPLDFPVTRKQEVLVLNFTQGGVLKDMHVLHKKDGIQVSMANGATPTPGTDISIIQELLGNVGKYNPMNNMGNTFGGNAGNNMGGLGQGTGNGGVGNSIQ